MHSFSRNDIGEVSCQKHEGYQLRDLETPAEHEKQWKHSFRSSISAVIKAGIVSVLAGELGKQEEPYELQQENCI